MTIQAEVPDLHTQHPLCASFWVYEFFNDERVHDPFLLRPFFLFSLSLFPFSLPPHTLTLPHPPIGLCSHRLHNKLL